MTKGDKAGFVVLFHGKGECRTKESRALFVLELDVCELSVCLLHIVNGLLDANR
jgi:hypothetical protein